MLRPQVLYPSFHTVWTQRRHSPTLLRVRSFRTERTNFAFCGRCGVVGLALTPPSLLKFSNFERLRRRNLQTVMTKYCARVRRVASPADRRQQQGHDLAAAGPPSATLNCPSRGRTSAVRAEVSADTKHETRQPSPDLSHRLRD